MKELTITKTLTAAGCNAQMELPLFDLVRDIIDLAASHANKLGIGYARLIQDGSAWVLSRISLQMTRFPKVGETYSVTTWIESFNRHFSARNFEITSSNGTNLGYIRSIWVAINIASRRPADLSTIVNLADLASDRPCPIPTQGKTRLPDSFDCVELYTVAVSDIDSNRHLTTARYVELVVNTLPLEVYDRNSIAAFEISFMRECKFGEQLTISSALTDKILIASIADSAAAPCCTAKMTLSER